ncbi:NAD(P)-binding domain-containing protein, partial [Bartonella sp. MU70NMGDW]
MPHIQFEKIALIGIGLIGSSLARMIKKKNLAAQISIATRRSETLKRARE